MIEKEIQFRDKQEVQGPGEPTKGGITFVPAVDIFETEDALTLVAEMPGVGPEGIRIDLKDDQLTLAGEADDPLDPKERVLLKEYETGRNFYGLGAGLVPTAVGAGPVAFLGTWLFRYCRTFLSASMTSSSSGPEIT